MNIHIICNHCCTIVVAALLANSTVHIKQVNLRRVT